MDIKVYNIATDELVPVTQGWVDEAQASIIKLAKQRDIIKKVAELKVNDPKLVEIEKVLLG